MRPLLRFAICAARRLHSSPHMMTTRRSLFLLVGVALCTSACVTPTGKPYDERIASRLQLGASDTEVVSALGKPWQAEPLGVISDSDCKGSVESWVYVYERTGKVQCNTTLKFDEKRLLCSRKSSTTFNGPQCQGVK
ncbi:MAG: hypothetical protein QM817_38570 [Archangium sp.]